MSGLDPVRTSVSTLIDIPRRYGETTPDAVALVHDGKETTYRELDLISNQVANGLIAQRVSPGRSRIAFLDKNSDSFFEVLFGAAKANCVLVPINSRLAPPEIAFALNDSEAEVLFVGEAFYPIIEDVRGQLTRVRTVIRLGELYSTWRSAQVASDPGIEVDADDVCLQLYTSGTTGFPKGVQITHRNFGLSSPRPEGGWRSWRPEDTLLLVMPLFHIAGCGTGILGLVVGLKLVIVRDFVARDILQRIERDRPTVAFLVPAMLQALVTGTDVERVDVSSLRHVLYGASPIPLGLLRQALSVFPRTRFFQVYGLTETTGVITVLSHADHALERAEVMKSCGRAVEGVEIRVIDPAGAPLPPNQVGEIVCRSAQNMKGYWHRPDETGQVLRGAWLHTGDAGYLDENGYLFIHDRIKDMIVSGAENVYPAEIERALQAHPDVAEVAVIGVPDPKWGEAVKALVVLRAGAVVAEADLISHVRARIAGYKVPKTIDFVDSLPRNPSGKVLKRMLRERYWQGYERRVN